MRASESFPYIHKTFSLQMRRQRKKEKKNIKDALINILYHPLCLLLVLIVCIFHRYKEQNVALKLVQLNGTPEEVAKRGSRFAREVTFLCRVQHKNLVKVRN
jgi:hypothetical protein